MDILPKIWSIKATNQHEANIIADYANPLNIEANGGSWEPIHSLTYYLTISGGKYSGGGGVPRDSTEIFFDDFERLVLNKEPSYEIY